MYDCLVHCSSSGTPYYGRTLFDCQGTETQLFTARKAKAPAPCRTPVACSPVACSQVARSAPFCPDTFSASLDADKDAEIIADTYPPRSGG